MKKWILPIAVMASISLAGCLAQQGPSVDSLQSRLDELLVQLESYSAEVELYRSRAEDAANQLEQATARITELQQELAEANRQLEGHGGRTVQSPENENGEAPGGNVSVAEPAASAPPANPAGSNGPVKVDLQGLGSGGSDAGFNDSDKECINNMESSGTWGDSIVRLFPTMTPGGVEKVVAVYLERHLFPGITTASGAQQIGEIIAPALPYLPEEARTKVAAILAEFS